jgi:hypothetical protein
MASLTLSTVMSLLLATVALGARQPPPPPMAEFAPRAAAQIEEAPEDQTSDVGETAGGGGGVASDDVEDSGELPDSVVEAESDAPVIEVARVRRCVGAPPRQIEDPQSPPCVAYFDGDNGGETYQGVTADEIRIAMPQFPGDGDATCTNNNFVVAMQNFFNSRFEFYGRKLRIMCTLQDFAAAEGGVPGMELAAAVAADEERQVFASMGTQFGGYVYTRELARRKVLSVGETDAFSEAEARALAPYVWQYPMGIDTQLKNFGDWACSRLSGQPASHTGEVYLAGVPTRSFGVYSINARGSAPEVDLAPLLRELEKCGGAANVETELTREAMIRMRDAGVTSIMCVCFIGNMAGPLGLMQYATEMAWFPEWIVTTYQTMDENIYLHQYAPRDQARNLFGVRFLPRDVEVQDDPWYWAASEGYPSHPWDGVNVSGNQSSRVFYQRQYRSLLLIASGVQLAGPDLTPASFERGLHGVTFSNSDYPTLPGAVGFTGASHAMTVDGAERWWDPGTRGPYAKDPAGTWCYIDGGRRHTFGTWPSGGDPFFFGACDAAA